MRAHPEGLCDKYESAETILLLLPSISLLSLIPYLLALLKKAKQESGQIMSKLLILAWCKHAYRIETGKYLTSSHTNILCEAYQSLVYLEDLIKLKCKRNEGFSHTKK